jgi:uncharacterized membrane protein
MDRIARIFVIAFGAILGAVLSSSSSRGLGALLGAVAAYAITELMSLRARMESLTDDVRRLKLVPRPSQTIPEPPPAAASPTPPAATEEATVRPSAFARPIQPAAPNTAVDESDLPLIAFVRSFFTGGNSLVRAGVVILFFGVAFLLRYMAEHTHLSIEIRLSGIALFGVALLILGWRLRSSRAGYALALQGGAVGILYLTVFAALRLYAILSAAFAFPFLVVVAALTAVLAVLQDSMWFALLAVTGGFLAPVLASSGAGNHVVLFSYYVVLNAGILGIAWFKAWRPLNIAGFVFTFAIGTLWGVLRYRPDDFASTEPFLAAFFLFYFAITILLSTRQPNSLKGYVDGTLVFGTPIVAFALQSAMLHERLMSLAFSAVAMSALYLSTAWLLKRRRNDSQVLLIEAFIALGVVFLTLAVPLALNARWSAASWALEGAALVWIGCRQNRGLARVFGALLIAAAGFITATQFNLASGRLILPVDNYFGVILQAAAAIFAAQTLHKYRQRLKEFEQLLPAVLFWLGLWWWLSGGLSEISQYWLAHSSSNAMLLITITALGCSALYQIGQLTAAKIAALLQLPVMFVFTLVALDAGRHPFSEGGWLAWPLAFVGLYSVLYSHEGASRGALANALNSASAWLFCLLFSWEASWEVNRLVDGGDSWPATAWSAIPAGVLFLLPRLVTRVKWPFAKNRDAYLFIAGVGIAAYLCGWSLLTNLSMAGDSAPLPYAPFLNPLDIGQAFVLLVLFRYWRFLRAVRSPDFTRIDQRLPVPILLATGFVWLNALLLRTLHQWFDVELGIDALFASTLAQTSLTIFWTVLAFTTMLLAARLLKRSVWIGGAVLLAVVIAKLFLVDLSRVGSIERIVSFVGVGLLMLVVGFFSPIPPAVEAKR